MCKYLYNIYTNKYCTLLLNSPKVCLIEKNFHIVVEACYCEEWFFEIGKKVEHKLWMGVTDSSKLQ